VWSIGNIREETLSPELIVTLSEARNYPISVEVIGRDIINEEFRENISGLPTISVTHTIEVDERSVPS